MKRVLTAGLVLIVLGLVVILVLGCASEDRAAAQRANAEAVLETARGQAYAERTRADAAAQAERAAIREAQQNAAVERAIVALPYVLIAVGVILVLVLVVLLAVRAMVGGQSDPALLGYLQRLELAQAERDRDLWRAIAHLDRRTLPAGDTRREVIIYPERRQ